METVAPTTTTTTATAADTLTAPVREGGEEENQPAIERELDCLNISSEKINQLENDLSKKRDLYRATLSESSSSLEFLSSKLGDCVRKARPYYEAVAKLKRAQNEIQKATIDFERAVSMHDAAKEMVLVAEQGMLKDNNRMDTAWPEMLNHATIKVNDAEAQRHRSEREHGRCAELFKSTGRDVHKYERKLKNTIAKSRPYYEAKKKVKRCLEDLSGSVLRTEAELAEMKLTYKHALKSLEEISVAIHKQRGTFKEEELGTRQSGVGAESSPRTVSPRVNRSNSTTTDAQLNNIIINNSETAAVVVLPSPPSTLANENEATTLTCNAGVNSGSSETIGSIRSNGSGTSEPSVIVEQFEAAASTATTTTPDKESPKQSRNELLLSVAALQSSYSTA